MSDQFNWQFEEDPDEPYGEGASPRWLNGVVLFWLVAVILTVALVGIWLGAREKKDAQKQDLVQSVQAVLELQQQAVEAKDGELFFAQQDDDPSWLAAQLLPQNQSAYRAGLAVTNAEAHGETVWANAAWKEQGTNYQRILFFEWRANQLRQIPTDPNYWGATLQKEEGWGTLTYLAADDPWASTIANYVNDVVAQVCANDCLEGRLPLTLEVRDDFVPTAEPNHLRIPSPRLLGLDDQGDPSIRFWQELSWRLNNYLTPAVIRFAVPPSRARDGQTVLPYANLAQKFMEQNPDITIEIVEFDADPQDLPSLTQDFDGAAFMPTEALLAAGLVQDLTGFIESDPGFDKADFYEQIWQGTVWRDHTWFLPLAAEMQVMYYDRAAYRGAEYPEPSARWTWAEMAEDVASIIADQPGRGGLDWGFLDVGLDSLYSYAYNWNNQCLEKATVFCRTPLQKENVAAALEWYKQMAQEPQQMPDLTGPLEEIFSSTQMSAMRTQLDEDRQALLLLNFQGSRRRAAIWVDSPVNYEFNLLLSPVGVVPFPGSDRFDGITPLWLQGGFISQNTAQPLAVWRWLKFLSYHPPIPRLIPARPSVAAESRYWTALPQPLEDAMRTAFPFARPVTIEEQRFLTWAHVAAVLSGEMTAQEAASDQAAAPWFTTLE